jgi:hypothetical protein
MKTTVQKDSYIKINPGQCSLSLFETETGAACRFGAPTSHISNSLVNLTERWVWITPTPPRLHSTCRIALSFVDNFPGLLS